MTTKTKAPFVRNPYNYDTNEASLESAISCPEPTLAQQQYKEESDINFIADRYGLTGEMPQVLQLPSYGNFEGVFDFQSAQNAVIQARNQFMTLPAKTRTRFQNDPQKLIEFLDNDENYEEAVFMGLVKRREDAPQSPQGNAGGATGGGTLPLQDNPPAEPDNKPAKKPAKDT